MSNGGRDEVPIFGFGARRIDALEARIKELEASLRKAEDNYQRVLARNRELEPGLFSGENSGVG